MKKYTFFLGLNDKDTKLQEVRSEDVFHEVEWLLATVCGGGTVTLSRWVFAHEDGTIVRENSLRIETLWYKDFQTMKHFAWLLKSRYNQESVLMEVSEVEAKFI